jgi:hypothetical protein
MQIYSRQFVNEKGDRVSLRVSKEERHGTKGISLFLGGPDSELDSFVTLEEAVEILEGLSKLLKPSRR